MICMVGEKFGLGYSPIAAIVVGFSVHQIENYETTSYKKTESRDSVSI